MIKCPECQSEISDTATACPNCGCPIMSKSNKLKAETAMEKAEIYKTAFKQSVIISMIFSLINIILCIKILNRGNSNSIFELFSIFLNPSDSSIWEQVYFIKLYMMCIGIIFIINIITIGAIYIIKKKNHKLDLKSFNTYKTLLVLWSGYIVAYSSCTISYWKFGCGDVSLILIPIIVVMLLFTISKRILEFNKYKAIFIIYGICSSLAIIYNVICKYYSSPYMLLTLTTIIIPFIMGILWCFNTGKSKNI